MTVVVHEECAPGVASVLKDVQTAGVLLDAPDLVQIEAEPARWDRARAFIESQPTHWEKTTGAIRATHFGA